MPRPKRQRFDLVGALAGRQGRDILIGAVRSPVPGFTGRSRVGSVVDVTVRTCARRADGVMAVSEIVALTGSARHAVAHHLGRIIRAGALQPLYRDNEIWGYQLAPQYRQGTDDPEGFGLLVMHIDPQREQICIEGGVYIGGATVFTLAQAREIAGAVAQHDAGKRTGTAD